MMPKMSNDFVAHLKHSKILIALGILLQTKFNPKSDFSVVIVPSDAQQWMVSLDPLDAMTYPYRPAGRVEAISLERFVIAEGKEKGHYFMVGYGKESNTIVVSQEIP